MCIHEELFRNRRFDAPTQSFSHSIGIPEFLIEYKKRIWRVNSEELLWVGQKYATFISSNFDENYAILLLETFLNGINDIMKLRAGRLSFRKTELLANAVAMIR